MLLLSGSFTSATNMRCSHSVLGGKLNYVILEWKTREVLILWERSINKEKVGGPLR